ncbi:MAG: S8 family serine peptidase [Thermoleophilia bacterium]|nr:S8 family serine peptidase [Thermoleophilia bacterium]
MRRRALLAALAIAVCVPPVAGAAEGPVAVTVQARPGQAGQVRDALGRGALRVQRLRGRTLQVVAAPDRVAALRRLPGVAAAGVATSAFEDETAVTSEGLFRTGAAAVAPAANGGEGLVIAILDLGFGNNIETLRAKNELPPAERTETRSFDTVNGLAGRNAYGNATNHGELVTQTVFDYAPRATFVLVNYRTPEDFVSAGDFLVARRPDIVVHSNNFIEGPFDGTGAAAQAVDRAAAAGVLWFNSAGNYAQRHWAGPWTDADGDDLLDFAGAERGLFYQGAGKPVTFAVSWVQRPSGPRTDLDIALERRNDDGSWTAVATSTDRQPAGAAPAERITGYLPPSDGFFRLAVRLVDGPPPVGDVTVFSREVDVPLVLGGSAVSSVPTPGDAAGGISVGAVDWRGDRLKSYSSHGPTADLRRKPDLVAPTDTSLAGPNGPRLVGGTSNAAPNAAGAAAVIIASMRAGGVNPAAADVRAQLLRDALDLGDPGPDDSFGAGRARVDLVPPVVTGLRPAEGSAVRGPVTVAVKAADPSRVARLTLWTGERQLAQVLARDGLGVRLDTRRFPDGDLSFAVDSRDWPGNTSRREWHVRVDNTPPVLSVRRVFALPRPKGRAPDPRRRRQAFVVISARDTGAPRMTLTLSAAGMKPRTVALRAVANRRIAVGKLLPGRNLIRLDLRDAAGNARIKNQVLRFR